MAFPLGKPILVLMIVALAGGVAIALHPSQTRAPLVMWTFNDLHAQSYREALAQKEPRVDVKLVNVSAESIRLAAMFDRASLDPNQPDVVEIEIGSMGRYLRGQTDEIGLLPLNEFLDREHWRERLVESRLAPWSKDGIVFGFPNDVHPVTISYRKDLFDEAGVDLAAATTWPTFRDACVQFQHYWQARGYLRRAAIELPRTAADNLIIMLLQRHINLLDEKNRVHLADDKVANTIAFYARLVASKDSIGAEATPGGNLWARDFAAGEVCALFTPDWRAGILKRYAQNAGGKVAMMPLPRFDTGDAPTATWGGTMAAIPRRTRDAAASWELITRLYADPQTVESRWRDTMILPAIKDCWSLQAFHESDSFFANQKVGELYTDLAQQIPPVYWSAFTPIANAQLTAVLSRAVDRVRDGDDANLERQIQSWLTTEAAELQGRIDFGKFE